MASPPRDAGNEGIFFGAITCYRGIRSQLLWGLGCVVLRLMWIGEGGERQVEYTTWTVPMLQLCGCRTSTFTDGKLDIEENLAETVPEASSTPVTALGGVLTFR